jgi:hypothetical protein
MTKGQAKVNLVVTESKVNEFDTIDFFTYLVSKGVPKEIVSRLEDLKDLTFTIGKQVIHFGKIILFKLMEFIEENPRLSLGIIIGAGIATLISMLVNVIPFIGQILSPIVFAVTAWIGISYFALIGHRQDKKTKGENVGNSIGEDVITLFETGWKFIVDIFKALKDEIKLKQ